MEEAESNTLASLRSGAMSILEAIAVELPDVFAVEVLPKVDLRDTFSLAQVSKRFRDAVWSADGVQSLQAKITRLPAAELVWTRWNRPYFELFETACYHDRPDVVMQLIKAGADVNAK